MKPYSPSYWRNIAAPIISKVLEETKGASPEDVRKAVREAYPFGQRKYHPYKIWCDEVKRQMHRPVKFLDPEEILKRGFRLDCAADSLDAGGDPDL